jgi:hypothetical protein
MDTASVDERGIGAIGSAARAVERSGGSVRALGFLAFAHVLAMLLALTGGVLLEQSITQDRWGEAAALCLGAAAALVLVARRGYRRALVDEERQRGLAPREAEEKATRRFAHYTASRGPSPW